MPYLRADDRVRLYYEEHGRGTPLVLAYGIGGNATMWDLNVPGLAARHRLILWEPRGHARSDSPEDPAKYSFQRWALDLKAVLDHLGLRQAHVGGLSLGAGIATRFALRFPGRARSLVVTNSSSASGLPLSWQNVVMRARSIEITLTQGMDAMAEFAMAENPNVSERLALDPGAKAEFYEEYRQLAPMRVMHRKIRGSKLVVLTPASHFANRDQPDAWNRAVLDFLARVEDRRRR